MNLTSTTPYLARRGLRDVILLYQTKQMNFWKSIVRVDRTKFIAETKQQFSGLGNARQIGEGTGVNWQSVTTPYKKEFTLKFWIVGFKCSQATLDYDPYGIFSRHEGWMAKSHYMAKEVHVASLFGNMTNGSYLGIDGVVLASASHPTKSGTFSNLISNALSESGLIAADRNLGAQKDYQDRPWFTAGQHALIVPRALETTAEKLLSPNIVPFVSDTSTPNVMKKRLILTPGNPFLDASSTTAWGLIPQDENPLFVLQGNDLDVRKDFGIDFWTPKIAAATEREIGWDMAQGTVFSTGA